MGLSTAAVVDALESLVVATGLFRQVNTHEPKRTPDAELTAAVWWVSTIAIPADSGLAVSSARSEFQVRLYTGMLQEPQDAIDPQLMTAADTVITDLHAGFTLGGTVQTVDVLGITGPPLNAQTGYLDIGGTMFRIVDIRVPVIQSNAWSQTA